MSERNPRPTPKRGARGRFQARKPLSIMERKQYHITITENDETLDSHPLDDPFIRTTIVPSGWKAAWMVLRGKLTWHIRVWGTPESYRVVFTGDYTPFEEGTVSNAIEIPSGGSVSASINGCMLGADGEPLPALLLDSNEEELCDVAGGGTPMNSAPGE